MNDQVWVAIVEVAFLILQLAAGMGGVVPIVKILKETFNFGLAASRFATLGITVALSLLTLVVEGIVSYDSVVSENPTITGLNIVIAILTALIGSQVEYLRRKRIDPKF